MKPELWSESEYRGVVRKTVSTILRVLDSVDPDIAEANESQGVLTIVLGDRSKVILSAQPSVRQIWLAIASHGIAHHLNWDPIRGVWVDDKKPEIELLGLLQDFFKAECGLALRWADGKSSE